MRRVGGVYILGIMDFIQCLYYHRAYIHIKLNGSGSEYHHVDL